MFEKLIEEFKLNLTKEKEIERPDKNIFDICGFPHYEVVISNILAFFFNSDEKHNLSDLFIKSLIASGIIEEINDFQFIVEREVRTTKGKFIDILLYNDSHCLVIENKIFAPLYNDLDEYLKYAEEYIGVQPIGIVLSLHKIETNNPKFINITYPIFIKNLKSNLGYYLFNGYSKYLFLLSEFISNLEYLFSKGVNMDKEFVKFLKKNRKDVIEFDKKLKKFHSDLRSLVNQVNNIVKEQKIDGLDDQWAYRELPELFDTAVSDFKLSNGVELAIDSVVNVDGWEFQIFVRRFNDIQFDIESYCNKKGLKGNIEENNRFILEEHYNLEAKAEEIAQKIIEIIGTIKI